jgi:hypothetical protein
MNSDWKERRVDEVTSTYRRVVDEITDLPGSDNLSGTRIVVDQVSADGVSHIDVYIKDDKDERWGIDFIDWNDLVDLKIEDRISNEVSEMLAHILYEITWWGHTRKSVNDQGMQMVREAEDADNIIEFSLSGVDWS